MYNASFTEADGSLLPFHIPLLVGSWCQVTEFLAFISLHKLLPSSYVNLLVLAVATAWRCLSPAIGTKIVLIFSSLVNS